MFVPIAQPIPGRIKYIHISTLGFLNSKAIHQPQLDVAHVAHSDHQYSVFVEQQISRLDDSAFEVTSKGGYAQSKWVAERSVCIHITTNTP